MALGGHAPLPVRLGGTDENGLRATKHARLCADYVAHVKTAPFARLTFTKDSSVVTVHAYLGMHGNGPLMAPAETVNGRGDITFTWTPSYLDPYESMGGISFHHGRITGHGGSCLFGTVELVANTARVRLFTTAGLSADGRATLRVW